MTLSDPVANMIASIRNANLRSHKTVIFPFSKFKWNICKKLEDNNFFSKCWIDEKKGNIKLMIKYFNKNSYIHSIKKISKPSSHIHLKYSDIKKKCQERGIYIISTSSGLLTQQEALEKKLGGKLLLFIS